MTFDGLETYVQRRMCTQRSHSYKDGRMEINRILFDYLVINWWFDVTESQSGKLPSEFVLISFLFLVSEVTDVWFHPSLTYVNQVLSLVYLLFLYVYFVVFVFVFLGTLFFTFVTVKFHSSFMSKSTLYQIYKSNI